MTAESQSSVRETGPAARRAARWLRGVIYGHPTAREELRGEIAVFRREIETIRALTEDAGGDDRYAENAIELLDLGVRVLEEEGDPITCRRYFYAAKRWGIIAAYELDMNTNLKVDRSPGDPASRADGREVATSRAIGGEAAATQANGGEKTEAGDENSAPHFWARWVVNESREALSAWRRRVVQDPLEAGGELKGHDQLDPEEVDRNTDPRADRDPGSAASQADGGGTAASRVRESQKVEALDEISVLHFWARRILYESREVLSTWRQRVVQDLLEAGGELKGHDQLDPEEVHGASAILHEYYINRELRKQALTRQFMYFIAITLVALGGIYAVIVNIPMVPGEGKVRSLIGVARIGSPEFLVLVMLFGVLGAATSGTIKIARKYGRLQAAEVPINLWLAVAQISIGAAAATVLFTVVTSGLIDIGGRPSSGLLLSVSFVAGFTERLLMRAVTTIAGTENAEQAA